MTTSRAKAKGTRWERDFCTWWNKCSSFVLRRTGNSSPLGDLDGLPGFVLELKDVADRDLPGHLAQAKASAVRKGVPHCAVVYKKRGTSPALAYVVMEAEDFLMLQEERKHE